MEKSPKKNNFNLAALLESKKLTVVLGTVVAVLVIAIVVLIALVPQSPEVPVETDQPTEATVVTESTLGIEMETVAPTETIPEETGPAMLPQMAELYSQNPDVIGYVKIDGTKIDYPVVYTPDDPLEYTYKNIEGKFHVQGSIILEGKCDVEPECMNLILHGHNMKNGTMFNNVSLYSMKSFWQEHPEIQYSSLYEERTYEVAYFFQDRIYDPESDVFKFYYFTNAGSEEEFNDAMAYFAKRAKYDTGITPQYGDRLLTLVTCDYGTPNGRFVVVARLKSAE